MSRRGRRVAVIAHRGASASAPENTAASVRLAVRMGADGVECDVQLSKDGVPVVFHDDDLARLCGARGAVRSLTAAELARHRVRVAGRRGTPDRILTLKQWLALLPRRVMAVVELKRQESAAREAALAAAAARLLERRRGRVAVISFSSRLVALASELLPRALVGPVLDRAPRGGRRPASARPLVALERRLATPARVATLARAGGRVWCWTVDDPAEARRLARLGVEGIISNRPDVARAALACPARAP